MNKKIVKISIYNSRCTPSQIMQGNGDAILDNICIECAPDENLETGEYYLDAIFLIDREGLWKHIQEESILKVQMDYGEEYFRIAKIQSTSRDITVFARQETIYQTLHMWLTDVRPENRNGLSALTHMKDNSTGPKNIKVSSDISTISTAYYQDMNMYKALHDCDQSFLNRWGGEIQRRGYNLIINKRIGTHRGVQIRSRKNLTGFEANVDIDNVFTRIKPKGYDGITIDGFVNSPLINNYPFIKTVTKTYDDVKVKDPEQEDSEGFETLEEAQAELIRRCELEFSQNHIDKIQASYRINFIQLEQTEEYKDYVAAERVFLGDEIDVYEETLDIELTVRAMRRKYDVLRERVLEVELSNEVVKKKPPTIGDLVNELDRLEGEMQENNNWYKDAVNNATDLIQNGLKDSYVIVRKNEVLIMDTTDINTSINVWRWNRGGLGFSSTGYYGTYETAITMDGSIVGKFITGLIVNGHEINAKNLNVYRDSDGVKSLEITSSGEVNLDVTNLKIRNEGVVTNSQLEQSQKDFQFKFEQSGGYNLLRNSAFKDGYNNWYYQRWDDQAGGNAYIEVVYPQYNEWTPTNRNSLSAAINGLSSSSAGKPLRTGFDSQQFNVKLNTTYSLNCLMACHRASSFTIEMICYDSNGNRLLDNNHSSVINNNNYFGGTDRNNWAKIKHTWTTQSNATTCHLRAYMNEWTGELDSAFLWMCEPIICEGDVDIPWSSNADELYSGITTIDKDGVKVSHSNINGYSQMSADSFRLNKNGQDVLKLDSNGLSIVDGTIQVSHNDGSYTKISYDGFKRYESGTGKNYHYLFDTIVVDASGKCDGTWFKVQLPTSFRGKQFTLTWQMGNGSVPINKVWAGHQVDVRNIDYNEATCEVSVKVFTKSQFSGGATADVSAYGWAKLFIIS